MDNILENQIKEIAEKHVDTDKRETYVEGVNDAIDAVRGYLIIASHLSKTVKISDIRDYLSRLKQ
jgi:hypothetical protein